MGGDSQGQAAGLRDAGVALRDAELHTLPDLAYHAVGHFERDRNFAQRLGQSEQLGVVGRIDEELLVDSVPEAILLHGSRSEAVGGHQQRGEERCGVHHVGSQYTGMGTSLLHRVTL